MTQVPSISDRNSKLPHKHTKPFDLCHIFGRLAYMSFLSFFHFVTQQQIQLMFDSAFNLEKQIILTVRVDDQYKTLSKKITTKNSCEFNCNNRK